MEDHVHILLALSRTMAISELVETVKTSSSIWIKTQGDKFSEFHWQRGYGSFSVSESELENVKNYIANQAAHHRKMTFQEEYRKLLERHGILYDERYVWD